MNLVSIPANPVPEGAVEGTLKTRDGVALRFARWPPPPGRKGTVCVFQGRAEFIEKYFEVVHDARARGFAVAMMDWRGQGLSDRALRDPRKGHVGSFSEFDLDIAVPAGALHMHGAAEDEAVCHLALRAAGPTDWHPAVPDDWRRFTSG